jgi:hypothetical protein
LWFLAACGGAKTYGELPFEPGEKLTYQIRWGVIPIGTGVLWVRSETELNGRPAYHLSAEGYSNSFLSVFYPVHDLVQSFWDAEKFQTLAFQKIQNEGKYHINEIYLFNPQAQKVKWFNSKRRVREFEIPKGVQDAISCLYDVRRLGMEKQKEFVMDLHQDEKNYKLSVGSIEEERVHVEALGKVKTWKVVPQATHQGVFLREGTMWVWFTQDEKRIPVQVQVKAPLFGRLTAELVAVETIVEPQPSEAAKEINEILRFAQNDTNRKATESRATSNEQRVTSDEK